MDGPQIGSIVINIIFIITIVILLIYKFKKNDISYDNIIKVIQILFIILITGILILLLATTYILKEKHDIGSRIQQECKDMFLEKERGDYKVYETYTSTIEPIYKTIFLLLAYIISFVSIVVTIIIGVNYKSINIVTNTVTNYALIFMVELSILTVVVLWFISIFTYSETNTKYQFSISPFYGNSIIPLWRIIINQIFTIVPVIIIVFLLIYIYLANTQNNEIYINTLRIVQMILITAIIILPVISYFMYKFELITNNYKASIDNLNSQLSDSVVEKNEAIANFDNFMENGNSAASNIDNKFLYALHTPNNLDIKVVVVPDAIKPYILQPYLKGKLLYSLKSSLVAYYHEKKNNSILKDYTNNILTIKILTDNNSVVDDIANKELNLIKTYFEDYLTSGILTIINKTTSRDNTETNILNAFINTINTSIIQNKDAFEKTNPMNKEVRDTLYILRNNTEIKDTVNNYYSFVRLVLYILLFMFLYTIYKQFVSDNISGEKYKIWAIMILVILILGGSAAFLSKELWL